MSKVAQTDARRVAVNVNLTAGLLDRLDRMAEDSGLTRSALVRQAVERMLEDAEDVVVSRARLEDPNDPLGPWEQVSRQGVQVSP